MGEADQASTGGFVTVPAPAVQVELFQDRAAVTRTLTVESSGRHRFLIGPVTSLVDARRISFPHLEGIVVEDVRVRLEAVPEEPADTAEIERLEAELRQVREQRESQADAVRRAREANLRARESSTAAQAATVRVLQEQDEVVDWAKAIQSLAEHQGATLRAVADAELRLAQLTEQETECARALDSLRRAEGVAPVDPQSTEEVMADEPAAPPTEQQAWIELSLLAEGPAEQLVRYVVPCAAWRPSHRAVLTRGEGGATVAWSTSVMCWNETGEAWSDVEIVCSTARTAHRPVQAPEPGATPEVPEGALHNGELGPLGPSAEQAAVERAHAGTVEAQDVPGVDDGGATRQFEIGSSMELPSGGAPCTFAVESWSIDAEVLYASVPEHSPHVVVRTSQVRPPGGALLAGPVDLVLDGTWVGRSQAPLVAEGDRFELDWGSAPGLAVDRRRETEIERQKPTDTLVRTFRVSAVVSNTTEAHCTVHVRERVPISEYSDVFVSEPAVEPATPVDEDGFCSWELALEPGSEQRLTLIYEVRSAADADLPFKGP